MGTAGLLLAAGLSRRYGTADKLLSTLDGTPLITHAARAMGMAGFAPLVAVVSGTAMAALLPSFACLRVEAPDPSQGLSLRTGVAHLRSLGVARTVIALGDMPFVTADLMRAVADRCTDTTPSAAVNGTARMPPACFPAALFDRLTGTTGDQGARAELERLAPTQLVRATAMTLFDIDTPADLDTAERWIAQAR